MYDPEQHSGLSGGDVLERGLRSTDVQRLPGRRRRLAAAVRDIAPEGWRRSSPTSFTLEAEPDAGGSAADAERLSFTGGAVPSSAAITRLRRHQLRVHGGRWARALADHRPISGVLYPIELLGPRRISSIAVDPRRPPGYRPSGPARPAHSEPVRKGGSERVSQTLSFRNQVASVGDAPRSEPTRMHRSTVDCKPVALASRSHITSTVDSREAYELVRCTTRYASPYGRTNLSLRPVSARRALG